MSTDSLRDFLLEQLSALDRLRCKRMFGGYSLYCCEVFFGNLTGDRQYFKVIPDTLPDYPACNAAIFTPTKKQVLKKYGEVSSYISKDAAQLTS
ncbi:MAG: TfoX/Sxy family protein [Sideroxyarcus sp.]|nr:TfoX/Sxy family protein [Sideroxyarcus sp.]